MIVSRLICNAFVNICSVVSLDGFYICLLFTITDSFGPLYMVFSADLFVTETTANGIFAHVWMVVVTVIFVQLTTMRAIIPVLK